MLGVPVELTGLLVCLAVIGFAAVTSTAYLALDSYRQRRRNKLSPHEQDRANVVQKLEAASREVDRLGWEIKQGRFENNEIHREQAHRQLERAQRALNHWRFELQQLDIEGNEAKIKAIEPEGGGYLA